MGQVELSDIEKKILPSCKVQWHQRIANHAKRIIEDCKTEARVEAFFIECEQNMKTPDRCRIVYNNEVHKFGGVEFSYIWFFLSTTLGVPIKISVRVDHFDEIICVGHMDIATKKEQSKLTKELNTPKTDDALGLKE